MFTIKAIYPGGERRHGYEAETYTVDEAEGTVAFVAPKSSMRGQDTVVTLHLGKVYERIVVENAAGKTVENICRNNPPEDDGAVRT